MVVVVALVRRLYRPIGLSGERAERPADHVIGLPGRAVVQQDPPPSPIAILRWRTDRAVQVGPAIHFALVIPAGEESTGRCYRQRGLPLHGRARVGIQLHRCAQSLPGVGRADVVDVAVIGRAAARHVLATTRVVEADDAAAGGGFAPAHVPPDAREDQREITTGGPPRPLAGRTGVDAGV